MAPFLPVYQFEMIRVCDGPANSANSYFSGKTGKKYISNGALN